MLEINSSQIILSNATLAYGSKEIFSHLTLSLAPNQWTALLGPSGIGKSSLLRMFAGLIPPKELSKTTATNNSSTHVKSQIAYMAQTDLLLPWLTVLANTLLSIKLRPHVRQEYINAKKRAMTLLERAGLSKVSHFYPHQLSGGMRQRAALVRTLMQDKPIILMDEPFSALDTITRYTLQALAVELLATKTVLFVTHDPIEALRLAHHIYILQGSPAVLKQLTTPASPTPRALNDPQVVALQHHLFQELSNSPGNFS